MVTAWKGGQVLMTPQEACEANRRKLKIKTANENLVFSFIGTPNKNMYKVYLSIKTLRIFVADGLPATWTRT